MKRIVTLLLAAGLVLGASVGSSKAADIKASGYWQFGFEWMDDGFMKNDDKDTFSALQRLRTKIDIITSENLRGVAFFEIGKSHWGQQSGGAALGTDGFTVKVRYSYVDWVVPETDLKIRMGLQPWLLPNFTEGSAILDGDGAGITASYQFNDMVGVTLGWLRAENNNDTSSLGRSHDELDLVMLSVPVAGDGFKVTPWGMYGIIGQDSLANAGKGGAGDLDDIRVGLTPLLTKGMIAASAGDISKEHGSAWWGGLAAEMTAFSPFRLAADFNYGSVDLGDATMLSSTGTQTMDMKRAGWYASLLAEYKLDFMTPGVYMWYGSGDDSNPYDGSERLPTIDPSWTGTRFGYADTTFDGDCFLADNPAGTWGVALILRDISFMENLSHLFEVAYIRGTNDKDVPSRAGMQSAQMEYNDSTGTVMNTYMTTKDYAWEVDFTTKYNIYKDLALMLELGYIRLELDEDVWGQGVMDAMDKNAYKVGLYMQYNF